MARSYSFVCPLPNGFHARPASLWVEIAAGFSAAVTLRNGRSGSAANAKSVLSMVGGDFRLGDTCVLEITGGDELPAMERLQRFIEEKLPHCDEALPAISTDRGVNLPRMLKDLTLTLHGGTPVSRGIGMGRIEKVGKASLPRSLPPRPVGTLKQEQDRMDKAIAAMKRALAARRKECHDPTQANLLKAHESIIGDVALLERLGSLIAQGHSAGAALLETAAAFIAQFENSPSAYLRERAVDMQDLSLELLEELEGQAFGPARVILSGPSVVVAEGLSPRELLSWKREDLRALVLSHGGTTSHAVILARSMGIPTLTGVENFAGLEHHAPVIVDADAGVLIARPCEKTQRYYHRALGFQARRRAMLEKTLHAPARSADGQRLEIAANIASAQELTLAWSNGAEGVGLFRTEMLFIGQDQMPGEEEQFQVYKQAAESGGDRRVILRMLDIGGDKPLAYLNIPEETNPFLGFRGVRIYKEFAPLVRTQLRAMLRASAFGPLQVMVPMVSTVEEVRWVRELLVELQQELTAEGKAFNAKLPLGIMLEVPSAAFMIEQLSRVADFFSIGTNDLTQYFMAVDRDNAKVAPLYTARHPGFLRLLQECVSAAHRCGRWIGLCGEMGGVVAHLPLLLAMGVDEISVASAEIPTLKAALATMELPACRELLQKALAASESGQVTELLEAFAKSPRAMGILDEQLVVIGSESRSKEEVLHEMVREFVIAGRTGDPHRVEEAIWAREAVYSTGLGYGIAIPHCKTDAMTANSIAVVKLREAVEWGSMDGAPVELVILLALRASEPAATHMKIFSKLARKLMHEEFRAMLLSAGGSEATVAMLRSELGIE